jgi:transketolase
MGESKSLRTAYGEALAEFGGNDKRIVVLDADLAHATMTSIFAAKYPERFFNFGIAEANMMCAAAGLAQEGFVPFVSTFALFGAGRAFEQVRNSIAYPKANVKLGLSHSGLAVGEDGGSHQSIEDIALMRSLPGMTIFVPCDPTETVKAVKAALDIVGPVYIRVARPVSDCITDDKAPFVSGKADILADGSDVTIAATGLMVIEALKAADILKKQGISAGVVNVHTIKPFDNEAIVKLANKTGAMVTVEDHSIIGGLGSATAEALAGRSAAKFERLGIADKFGKSGAPADLYREYGLTPEHIAERCRGLLK